MQSRNVFGGLLPAFGLAFKALHTVPGLPWLVCSSKEPAANLLRPRVLRRPSVPFRSDARGEDATLGGLPATRVRLTRVR